MEPKPLNVAIVGGGPGCKAIIDMIFAKRLSQLNMKLIGVACSNPSAVGHAYAQEKGIYTTTDYRDLYELKDLNMLIELTRLEGLANEIFQTKPEHIRLMDHVSARVFWDVFRVEEERIAERKRSEETTRLAYAELNQIFATSADGMRVIDKDFNVLRVNQTFEVLSGMNKDEAIGRKCHEVFGGPLCHTPGCPLTRIFSGEERIERDAEKERSDGTKVSCIVTATAFRKPGGQIVGIVEGFKDITERKRAEQALLASEKKYRNLVDNALVGVYKTHINGDILYVNEALARVFEFETPEEMMSENVLARYKNPKDREALFDALQKYGRVTNFQCELLTNTGKTIHALLTAVRDEDAISGMILDVTDREQAEEELRASLSLYQATTESTADGLLVVNRDGKIASFNQKFLDMWHIPDSVMATLEDEQALAFVLEQLKDAEKFVARVRELYAEPETAGYDVIEFKDGRVFERYSQPQQIEGVTVGRVWSFRNVTEQKRAEEALETERQRLYSLLHGLPAFVCLLAPDYSVRFANQSLIERFGDARGRRCYEVLGNRKEPCKVCHTFEVFKTNTPIEWEWTAPQGTTYQVYDYPFSDVDGSPLVLELGIDITERKRLEAQLQQAQKMEAIGTLAGGIAHDFNNVLMAIQGHTSLVLLHTDPGDSHFEHLRGVEDMVQKGADLTRQLLGFARGGKYEVKPTNLNELVEKSSEMFGRTKKEIKIHQKHQKEIWAVEVDQTQIEQVLLNLYVNAWQAMPHGGDLYVETSHVFLDKNDIKPLGVKPGNYVKVSVTDTGVGMDRATQQRVFDPFFTTKELGRGTGLGLASAYGIIKNHGGIINVYSEKEKGTTFTVYLPASGKEVVVMEKKVADEVLTGTEIILLVDDENEVLDVGEKMLNQMGYKVLLARSGKEAVEVYMAKKGEIDLVVLDMIMPDLGGGEAYDKIRENNPDVKVLLSSGYSVDGQATEILDRGCDGFIQKPFGMKELSHELREILNKD